MHLCATLLTSLLVTSVVALPSWDAHRDYKDTKDYKDNKDSKDNKDWKNNNVWKDNNDWKNKFADKWNKNDYKDEKVFVFDKTFMVKAEGAQVVNPAGVVGVGQPKAKGLYKFGINIADNTICYNITLTDVTGTPRSPALTATHIHEARKGANGPPRLSFPDPVGPDERRISYGCLTGPFKVGLPAGAKDFGADFHVKQIVEHPEDFFADFHTDLYVAGAVRGQIE